VKYISTHRFKQLSIAISLTLGALSSHAQTPAAAPPPAWKQGMPANMATSTLAPLPGKLTATKAADVPAPVDLTAKFNLPPEKHHNWKYIAFGPDGKLYVPFGAPCNICEPPSEEYAQIRRYNADGSGMEVLARGVRNTVGFDWHPVTKEMWFSNHGRDWLGDDTPNDTMHRMKLGGHYGFPSCHQGNMPDPDVKKAKACDGVEQPVALMGPHSATMGVTFYSGNMFPPEYRNVLFNARKGSWNRTKKIGHDVVMVRADADGKNAKVEPFMTGFSNEADQTWWGRPAYLHQMNDGAMLVSDEQNGVIYRVSYSK
jgi:glucose/arabinose dehydrogenase